MARTNIEETSWKPAYKLAALIGEHPNMVIGTLAMLWHESQSLLKIHGSRDDVMNWAGLGLNPDPVQDRWLKGMLACQFIEQVGENKFEVIGNAVEIEERVTRIRSGTKGAEATKKLWAERKAKAVRPSTSPELKADRPCDSPELEADRLAEPGGLPGSIQDNAIQDKPTQANASDGSGSEPRLLGKFPIEDGFRDHPVLDPVISAVTDKTQRQWLRTYPVGAKREWLLSELSTAVQHYQERGDFDSFGSRLTSWINRAKKPDWNSAAAQSTDPFAFFDQGVTP